ncbi:MAG: class beta-lactamase-related serine hydrolase [Gammaproteobacteria bacterium]|nr:class beta-lactamase-related serine hydrolase [Gammaproteobacteria bacterium]
MYVMKRLTAIFLGLLATVVGAQEAPTPEPRAAAPTVALTAEDVDAWLDGYMPYALQTGDIAGAVVAVVKDGKVLTERGYGFSDVAQRTPVDPKQTLFRPGSVSKLLTWTAVMQLVEQGKIDLDADINKYLDYQIPARDGKPVTMRNLMQHTAGFEEQAKGIISEDPNAPAFEVLLKQWVPERVFDAGTTQAYSNYGASLAGYIVQRVSGESFDAYIEKHIFEPLDMKYSSFRQPLPAQLVPLMSKGYRVASGEPGKYEIVGPAPAGSLASPAEDMAHFMIAHLQDGEYNGKRILTAATARQMHDSPLTLLPPLNRMELGFFETNINGREVIAHLGDTEYFHTSLHLFLAEGVGFYVSFNSPGKQGAAGGLRTAVFQAFADRYFPETQPQALVDAQTSAAHAALLKGSWVNSRGSRSSFMSALDLIGQTQLGLNAKGGLLAPFPGLNGLPRQWVEVAPFIWRDLNSHERLGAKVVDGKAVRFSIDLLSPFMVFERPAWYRNSSWLRPVFFASVAALFLTALFWPITAITRRQFGSRLTLDAPALRAYRLSKIGATAIVAGTAAWAALLGMMLTRNTLLSGGTDGLLRLIELFGIVAFVGGFVCMLMNLRAVWTGTRRWPAKTWSVVLSLSAFFVLWVAFVFNLISLGVNY